MGQLTSTYRLDRRSKTRYYLHLSFDLWNMALLNSHIVYGKLTQRKSSHLDFQVTEAKSIIGNYNNWRRNPQIFATTKHVSNTFPTETQSYLPKLEPSRGRCHYCKNQGKKTKHLLKSILVGCYYA